MTQEENAIKKVLDAHLLTKLARAPSGMPTLPCA